ncbi:MAG: sulfatase-like hydrolase/transferase [Gammaproteobacteria bacterium]|nr:sulfatase-like hydrolase/transferase [Gammaproteobacteria bacterium]
MLYVSFAFFALTLLLLLRRQLGKTCTRLQFIPMTAVVFLTLFYLVADFFTADGIDESVIYHLRVGLGGAGFKEYAGIILATSAALVAWLLIFSLLARRSRPQRSKLDTYSLLLTSVALIGHPASHDLYQLFVPSSSASGDFARHYIASPQFKTTQIPLNVVYIYAESLEATYFDEDIFPGLMPRLQQLKQQAMVFDNVAQVKHSGWTIAGMVASQCGVPLFTPGDGNSLSGMSSFMSGAVCMGDVLAGQGYQLAYMGGANTAFAGKKNFYQTHGFSSIEGKDELEGRLDNPDEQSGWGIYDDDLFSFAKDKLAELQQAQQPFGLFLLTLDTHHPQGHLSTGCNGLRYMQGKNPMLDAVHCADHLLGNFIDGIRQAGLADNTLIVLASDHLAMKNTAFADLQKGDRKNTFILFPPDLQQPQQISTPATILDTGVTVLAQMGFQIAQLGFGRNILGPEPTLLATQQIADIKELNRQLESSRSKLGMLWGYPALEQGLVFAEQEQRVQIDEARYEYPLLMFLGQNSEIESIAFDFNAEFTNAHYLEQQPAGRKYIWIDQCYKLSGFYGLPPVDHEYCIGAGQLGNQAFVLYAVEPAMQLSLKRLSRGLQQTGQPEQTTFQQQLQRLKSLAEHNTVIHDKIELPDDFPYSALLAVSASGIHQGNTFIQTRVNGETHTSPPQPRGLTLFSLDGSEIQQPFFHLDFCAEDSASNEQQSLSSLVSQQQGEHVLLLVHDTLYCSEAAPARLAEFFANSQLEGWQDLAFRQGYLALLGKDGQHHEFPSSAERTNAVVFLRKSRE